MILTSSIIASAREAALLAGEAIMKIYTTNYEVEFKKDGSPLTQADLSAHAIIMETLANSEIDIISEEATSVIDMNNLFWLVDPLDGTKDFIHKNDEFTVNIALIQNARPILGIVYAPALNELYIGGAGIKAYVEKNGVKSILQTHPKRDFLVMATSRFHDHPTSEIFAAENNIKSSYAIGSSLKYCRMAEGKIDVYPRMVGSSEWDTAAGQAVLEAANGSLIDIKEEKPLLYGKQSRRNGKLLAFRYPYVLSDFVLSAIKNGEFYEG